MTTNRDLVDALRRAHHLAEPHHAILMTMVPHAWECTHCPLDSVRAIAAMNKQPETD